MTCPLELACWPTFGAVVNGAAHRWQFVRSYSSARQDQLKRMGLSIIFPSVYKHLLVSQVRKTREKQWLHNQFNVYLSAARNRDFRVPDGEPLLEPRTHSSKLELPVLRTVTRHGALGSR
jgi:hypothetical protein